MISLWQLQVQKLTLFLPAPPPVPVTSGIAALHARQHTKVSMSLWRSSPSTRSFFSASVISLCTAISAAFFAASLASFTCFIFSSISCSSSSSLRPSRSISPLMRVTSDLNMALSSGCEASAIPALATASSAFSVVMSSCTFCTF
jgi:hypothetical protein